MPVSTTHTPAILLQPSRSATRCYWERLHVTRSSGEDYPGFPENLMNDREQNGPETRDARHNMTCSIAIEND